MNLATCSTSSRRLRIGGAVATLTGGLLVAGALLPLGSTASATKPAPDHKVTLCHATSSRSNPYVSITVDVASVFSKGHDGHNGPVFSATLPEHQDWGDIIPSFSYDHRHYDGKNLSAAGRAILAQNCSIPPTTTTTIVVPATTLPPVTTTLPPETTTTEPGPDPDATTIPPVATTQPGPEPNVTTIPAATTTVAPVITTDPGATTVAPPSTLPSTGSETAPIAFAGLALLIAGTGLLSASQRGRTPAHARRKS